MTVTANSSVASTTGVDQPESASTHRHRGHRAEVEDSTKLSTDSVQAQQLKDTLNRLPEARAERVAAVKESLSRGTQATSEQIAGAMVDEFAN